MLAYAFGWRRLIGVTARDRPQERVRIDALPPSLLPRPRASAPRRPGSSRGGPADRAAATGGARRRASARQRPRAVAGRPGRAARARAPPRRAGRARPRRHRRRGGRAAARTRTCAGARVELEYGRESLGIEISRADTFVATTWWTAHVARAALGSVAATASSTSSRTTRRSPCRRGRSPRSPPSPTAFRMPRCSRRSRCGTTPARVVTAARSWAWSSRRSAGSPHRPLATSRAPSAACSSTRHPIHRRRSSSGSWRSAAPASSAPWRASRHCTRPGRTGRAGGSTSAAATGCSS